MKVFVISESGGTGSNYFAVWAVCSTREKAEAELKRLVACGNVESLPDGSNMGEIEEFELDSSPTAIRVGIQAGREIPAAVSESEGGAFAGLPPTGFRSNLTWQNPPPYTLPLSSFESVPLITNCTFDGPMKLKTAEGDASEPDWVPYGKTYKEFQQSGLYKPGVEFEIEGSEGTPALIGDVNDNGGGCDCCRWTGNESIVTRYRVLLKR